MEQTITLGNLITLLAFFVTVAGIVWKSAAGRVKMSEQIEAIRKNDDKQDTAITRLEGKTTKLVTAVAVIDERTKHIQESGARVEKALETLLQTR